MIIGQKSVTPRPALITVPIRMALIHWRQSQDSFVASTTHRNSLPE
jgi:hypothetical protein